MEGSNETLKHLFIKMPSGLLYLASGMGAQVIGLPLSMEGFSPRKSFRGQINGYSPWNMGY